MSYDRIIGIDLYLMRSLNKETVMRESRGHEPTRYLQCWQITLSEMSRTGLRSLEGLRQGERLGHCSREDKAVMEGVEMGPDESQERSRGRV